MRDALQLLAVAFAVLILGGLGYRAIFGGTGGAQLILETTHGEVLVESGGGSAPARPATRLRANDRLVTARGGQAVLTLGGESRLTVEESSSLTVLGLEADGVRIELEGGRIQATIRPGGASLGVVTGGGEIQADDADFAIQIDERGAAVETTRGSLELMGFLEIEGLSAGERLLVLDNNAPVRTPIPEDLLLEVRWPDRLKTREDVMVIIGETEPGARVQGATRGGASSAVADHLGRFELHVPLAEGDNALAIEATGMMGERAEVARAVIRDGSAPVADIEIRY